MLFVFFISFVLLVHWLGDLQLWLLSKAVISFKPQLERCQCDEEDP